MPWNKYFEQDSQKYYSIIFFGTNFETFRLFTEIIENS